MNDPATARIPLTTPIGFVPGFDRVVLEEVDASSWRVEADLLYQGSISQFVVPIGTISDLASVPRCLTWAVPRYGSYTRAALLHDRLWSFYVPRGELSYGDANGVFRQAMRTCGTPFAQRWVIWSAVSWGACARPGGWRALVAHLPLVLLWTLLALPFVLPGAVVAQLSILLVWLVEHVVYGLLRVASSSGKRIVRPRARDLVR